MKLAGLYSLPTERGCGAVMHSRFRISNSSDRQGLDLGVAGLQRVPPAPGALDKERKGHSTEELRLYLEPRLHCSKLLPKPDEPASKVAAEFQGSSKYTMVSVGTNSQLATFLCFALYYTMINKPVN